MSQFDPKCNTGHPLKYSINFDVEAEGITKFDAIFLFVLLIGCVLNVVLSIVLLFGANHVRNSPTDYRQ
jgi:hypothetical protein